MSARINDELAPTYEALKAERDAALKAIAAMYEAVTGERPEWSNWHAYLDDIVEEVDAALAAIRADAMVEGAEACVRALVTSDDDDFTDAPNICAMVAYQLREAK